MIIYRLPYANSTIMYNSIFDVLPLEILIRLIPTEVKCFIGESVTFTCFSNVPPVWNLTNTFGDKVDLHNEFYSQLYRDSIVNNMTLNYMDIYHNGVLSCLGKNRLLEIFHAYSEIIVMGKFKGYNYIHKMSSIFK